MLILSIDQSTRSGSLALLQDEGRVVAEQSWEDSRTRNQHLFSVLPGFLAGTSAHASDIDLFVVGTGPGSFSGLRISLAAVEGMALPGRKPVRALSSGMAIAWDAMSQHKVLSVAVVGDARRNRFWVATFAAGARLPELTRDYALIGSDELPEATREVDLVVSPDWDRVGERIVALVGDATHVHPQAVRPRAATLGELGLTQTELGQPLPERPITPIYLHPPVFVEPRFTARDA